MITRKESGKRIITLLGRKKMSEKIGRCTIMVNGEMIRGDLLQFISSIATVIVDGYECSNEFPGCFVVSINTPYDVKEDAIRE